MGIKGIETAAKKNLQQDLRSKNRKGEGEGEGEGEPSGIGERD